MNVRVENRKVVEKLLGPAVEDVSIPPAVVTTIAEGPVDANWIKALQELDKRSKTFHANLKNSDRAKAALDVKPLLDNLTNKVFVDISLS